jgi:hypothetical protein
MRSLVGLALVLLVSSSARGQETDWLYSVTEVVSARGEEELARACDQRLAEVLSPMAAPRVLWRRTEQKLGEDGQLLARLHAVVSTSAPLEEPLRVEPQGSVRPGHPLALHRIRFVFEDRNGPIRVPTEAAAATSVALARRRADLLARRREQALFDAGVALIRATADAGGSARNEAWKRADARLEVQREEGEDEWVLFEVRVEAVFVGVAAPPAPLPGRALEKLAAIASTCDGSVASSTGLSGAVDLRPAKRGGKKKHGGH